MSGFSPMSRQKEKVIGKEFEYKVQKPRYGGAKTHAEHTVQRTVDTLFFVLHYIMINN